MDLLTALAAALALALACAMWALVQRASPRGDGGACGSCAPTRSDGAGGASVPRAHPLGRLRASERGAARVQALAALLVAGLAAALLAAACGPGTGERSTVVETRGAMGTSFAITVVTEDEAAARAAIDAAFAEIDRVERLLSEWRDDSEITRLNAAAGAGPVAVGPELYEVVERSLELSELTGGAFDITVAACSALWSFAERRVPGDDELERCLARVGSAHVALDRDASAIGLDAPGVRLGIAGIGKGYGVDAAARVLEERDVRDYIVDGGGDVRLAGRGASGPWRVGIAHPREEGRLFGRIEPPAGAVVTSGDYMQGFEKDGVRYHHILDPATGRPARKASAATVIAPDATSADALATGLFVLGPEEGIALAERLPDVEALIFDPEGVPRATGGFPAR